MFVLTHGVLGIFIFKGNNKLSQITINLVHHYLTDLAIVLSYAIFSVTQKQTIYTIYIDFGKNQGVLQTPKKLKPLYIILINPLYVIT